MSKRGTEELLYDILESVKRINDNSGHTLFLCQIIKK